jgi:hypothetical protein
MGGRAVVEGASAEYAEAASREDSASAGQTSSGWSVSGRSSPGKSETAAPTSNTSKRSCTRLADAPRLDEMLVVAQDLVEHLSRR